MIGLFHSQYQNVNKLLAIVAKIATKSQTFTLFIIKIAYKRAFRLLIRQYYQLFGSPK